MPCPGLCPAAPALSWLCPSSAPALGGFPGGKFHQTPSFTPEESGAPVGRESSPGSSWHQCPVLRCQEGSGRGGHLSWSCQRGTAKGSPCWGTAGSPAAGAAAPVSSRGVLAGGQGRGGGAEEAASEEEHGRGSRELAPAPGSPGAPTAAGGHGPAAAAPAKYLPEWHRAMNQPPTRPVLRGKARHSPALHGKARQSRALGGKARLSVAKPSSGWALGGPTQQCPPWEGTA